MHPECLCSCLSHAQLSYVGIAYTSRAMEEAMQASNADVQRDIDSLTGILSTLQVREATHKAWIQSIPLPCFHPLLIPHRTARLWYLPPRLPSPWLVMPRISLRHSPVCILHLLSSPAVNAGTAR